jgi:hypothetical protein
VIASQIALLQLGDMPWLLSLGHFAGTARLCRVCASDRKGSVLHALSLDAECPWSEPELVLPRSDGVVRARVILDHELGRPEALTDQLAMFQSEFGECRCGDRKKHASARMVGASIDVVSVEGRLITVDNTRLLAAHLSETPVQAVIHGAARRFQSQMTMTMSRASMRRVLALWSSCTTLRRKASKGAKSSFHSGTGFVQR